MSKQLQETSLITRTARAGLAAGTYWRGLDQDIHLGYRRSKRGGRWLVRWYEGGGKYRQQVIGVADDVIAAGNLDFAAASKAARELVVGARNETQAAAMPRGPIVKEAVESYIAMRDERDCARAGRQVKSDAHYKLTAYVLSQPDLCALQLAQLTEQKLQDWVKSLPASLARTTCMRIINDFKAALNDAVAMNRSSLAQIAPVVQSGFNLSSSPTTVQSGVRESQILSDDQVRAVLAAAKKLDEDLWRMLLVLAATGARFSQVKRMRVCDVQYDRARLMVPESFKGKKQEIGYISVQVGPDILEAMRVITEDRDPDAILLERWRHKQTKVGIWERDRRGPWQTPSETIRAWNEIRDACGLEGRVAYALRHSSIVRSIGAGIPLRLVAALHDTSVGMIEKHYSRWIVDGLEELAARAIVPLI